MKPAESLSLVEPATTLPPFLLVLETCGQPLVPLNANLFFGEIPPQPEPPPRQLFQLLMALSTVVRTLVGTPCETLTVYVTVMRLPL